MNGWMVGWLLPLALVWPLLVAGAVASRPMRALGLMVAPWAALPALVVALAAPDTVQRLPGVMLGSVLLLDDTGRPFLLATALLWLAAGLLARGAAAEPRFVLLLLLAMTGGIGLALAGDLSLLLAASTLAGYALYGLLTERGCGRVLVLLLVASDLLVFELLLLLASGAGGLELAALRAQWAVAEDQWLLLPLLLMGFGARGLLGVHLWLAPAFAGAPFASRPALVAFMLAAGLLGWLRLLPLGEVQWPAAGGLLQWLGLAAIGYAAIAGLLQARLPAVLAYAAVALTGLWTCVLGAVLAQPGLRLRWAPRCRWPRSSPPWPWPPCWSSRRPCPQAAGRSCAPRPPASPPCCWPPRHSAWSGCSRTVAAAPGPAGPWRGSGC